ncbi:MAG: hypothetical protein ABSF90_22560 [Syntrophobacteraceae bacterium]|jgi:hypothetical protein
MSRYPHTLHQKVLAHYFAVITKSPYSFAGQIIQPTVLAIDSNIVRGSDCKYCGACCRGDSKGKCFSLDWLPFELEHLPKSTRPRYEERYVKFNEKDYLYYTDEQLDNKTGWCRYLTTDAKCEIHDYSPFSCDFELIRCYQGSKGKLLVKTYNRPQAMFQYKFKDDLNRLYKSTGKDGVEQTFYHKQFRPQCVITTPSDKNAKETIRKLQRLQLWAEYFELSTHLPQLIKDLQAGLWRIHPQLLYRP